MTDGTGHDRVILGAPDGRQLEVLLAGPPEGMPLVFHNGTPSGLVEFGPMTRAASARGLRMVLYSRPGYGGSTPQPGRIVADAAADVAAILDQIGAGQFLTAGASGGGPHALACAALLPGRCLAAASIAGVAPRDAPGLNWLGGMGPENIEEFTVAAGGEEPLTAFLEAAAAALRDVTAAQLADAMAGLASATDKAALTGEYAGYLASAFRAAVSTGIAGWRDDDLAFVRDWGFSVTADRLVPVAIWQGTEDRMVPYPHGQWLAAHVLGARAHLLPGEGHLTLTLTSFGEILDDLLDLAGLEIPEQPVPNKAAAPGRPQHL
jgi:pimeloyl-ACP methyl ester carboxylesterase